MQLFKTLGLHTPRLFIVLAFCMGMVFLHASHTWAQDDLGNFEVLFQGRQSIQDFIANDKPISNFVGLIVNIITAIVVMAGLLSIIIGGYFYVTSGGEKGGIQKAKIWISSALVGIALALTAWIILNTINPNILLEPQLNLPDQGGDDGGDF